MPDTTAHGFPFAEGSDPLGDMNVTLQKLSEFLERNVKILDSGDLFIPHSGAATPARVNFTSQFTGVPNLVFTNNAPRQVDVGLTELDATGFGLVALWPDGSPAAGVSVSWIARG